MNDMKQPDYTNSSQQRILNVLLTMFGHEINGLEPGQIAEMTQTSPSNITRDIFNLRKAGFVEQLQHDENRFRVSPMIGQKSISILTTIERAASRVDEAKNRYTRNI